MSDRSELGYNTVFILQERPGYTSPPPSVHDARSLALADNSAQGIVRISTFELTN